MRDLSGAAMGGVLSVGICSKCFVGFCLGGGCTDGWPQVPAHQVPAHPKQVLVHRIEEARQAANRKRDDRQNRREQIAAADLRPAADR